MAFPDPNNDPSYGPKATPNAPPKKKKGGPMKASPSMQGLQQAMSGGKGC